MDIVYTHPNQTIGNTWHVSAVETEVEGWNFLAKQLNNSESQRLGAATGSSLWVVAARVY